MIPPNAMKRFDCGLALHLGGLRHLARHGDLIGEERDLDLHPIGSPVTERPDESPPTPNKSALATIGGG
jgi:hypothetical protein